MKRPAGVPAEAAYFKDWQEWGQGKKVSGKMSGTWKFWREDGSFVEESEWVDGKLHGLKKRYHDDGSVATEAIYVADALESIIAHRPDAPTREPDRFGPTPPVIRKVEYRLRDNTWQISQRFWTGDGDEIDLHGKPIPERPDGVPETAFWSSEDDLWVDGIWHRETLKREGLRQYWKRDGCLRRAEYYREGKVVAILDPNDRCKSNPLIEAARAGDEAAVERLLNIGAGASPGADIHAAIEGLDELCLRIRKCSEEDKPAVALEDPRRPSETIPPPAEIEGLTWVAALESWMSADVDSSGKAQGSWNVIDAPVGTTYVTHRVVDFEDGKKIAERASLRQAFDGDGQLLSETEFFEDGQAIRTFFGPGQSNERRFDSKGRLISEHRTYGVGRAAVRTDKALSVFSLDSEALEELRADPKGIEALLADKDIPDWQVCHLGDAWHGIHFVLVGEADAPSQGENALELLVAGGEPVGEDPGCGQARIIDPARTRQWFSALVAVDDFERALQRQPMEQARVAGLKRREDANRNHFVRHYEELHDLLEGAADSDEGLLVVALSSR